ncbi:MAG: hypothetical protein GY809_28515, partial [Planctomycetes bacterium]|nr:hypothetical protein [Planctomycetota bacterium]
MMIGLWLTQILAVMRLEMKKTFFAKRGAWVYLLAFAPVVLYLVHSINNPRERQRLADLAAEQRVSTQALHAVERGLTYDQVIEKLGEPYDQDSHTDRRDGQEHEYRSLWYTDGETKVRLFMYDGEVRGIRRRTVDNLVRSQTMFATSFQFYFLRLAIFFG